MNVISSRMLPAAFFVLSTIAHGSESSAVATGKKPDTANAVREADARCYWVGTNAMGSPDTQARNVGMTAMMYFWGRIEASVPAGAIVDLLVAQHKALASMDPTSEQKRCGALIQDSGKRMVLIGQEINKREDSHPK